MAEVDRRQVLRGMGASACLGAVAGPLAVQQGATVEMVLNFQLGATAELAEAIEAIQRELSAAYQIPLYMLQGRARG